MAELLDFEMEKHAAGYRLAGGRNDPKAEKASTVLLGRPAEYWAFIEPVGTNTMKTRPLENFPALYMDIAKVRKTPDAVLAAANRYGLLCLPRAIPLRKRDTIEDWYSLIDNLRAAIKAKDARDWAALTNAANRFGRAEIHLAVAGPSGGAVVKVVPTDLRSAIWTQFANAVAGNAKLKSCEECGKWFPYGTNTGRRETARFCDDSCRKANFNKRKGKTS